MRYASFWTRFCAALVDGIIVKILAFLLILFVGLVMAFTFPDTEATQSLYDSLKEPIGVLVFLLYFVGMESSKKQATLGKQCVKIQVTNLDGYSISFGQGIIRTLSKFISTFILLIGYIMAAFTDKKQALHDMAAGTLVIKNKNN
jgi:uncharacterized RDD family membrane protein YckC